MVEILVTGWGGFIGKNLVKKLKLKAIKVRLFRGDVRNVSDWKKNLKKSQAIIYLAGTKLETKKDFEVNSNALEKMFQCIQRGGKIPSKIIYASSQAIYSGCKVPYKESMIPKPTTYYGKSKLKGEKILLKYGKILKIPVISFRICATLGAGIRKNTNMSGSLERWVRASLNNQPIIVLQNGKQLREYIGIKDVVSAFWLGIKKINKGIFNLGSGKKITMINLARLVKKATKSKSRIIILGGKASGDDPRIRFSDSSKLEELGWAPQQSIKSAVEDYIKSCREPDEKVLL